MSWLKEKLFGKKPRVGSCHFGDSDEGQDTSCEYNHQQLWSFISRGRGLQTRVLGSDHLVAEKYVIYRISVSTLGQEYTIDRRYSEFRELHEHYSRFLPEYDNPGFPCKIRLTPAKSLALFTNYSCPSMLGQRARLLNDTLALLNALVGKMPDTRYIEWLELDKHILQSLCPSPVPRSPVSPVRTMRSKRPETSSATKIRSFLDVSVLSEVSQHFKLSLQKMTSGDQSRTVLKALEDYIVCPDNKPKIKQDDISRPDLPQAA